MNAAETIQAAIDRLEKFKADSTPGPWFTTYERSRWPRIWGNWDENDADAVAQTEGGTGNAHLIVTLHRTIDAQLAILRRAHRYLSEKEEGDPGFWEFFQMPTFCTEATALAHAILGEAS